MLQAKKHIFDLMAALKKETRWMPSMPDSTDSLDQWFDFYHECMNVGHKFTIKDMAKELNMSKGHLYNEHGKYKAERGI